MLDDGDSAPESSQCLGKFQAYIAPSDDDQMLRQSLQIQGLHMGHWRGCRETWHFRDAGARADIDEDSLAAQQSGAASIQVYLYRFQFRESGLAHDEFRAARLKIFEMQLHQFVDHSTFASGHARHIDLH